MKFLLKNQTRNFQYIISAQNRFSICVVLLFISTLISSNAIYAQNTNAQLDSLRDSFMKEMDNNKQEFNDSADSTIQAFNEYQAKLYNEYNDHCNNVVAKWGDSVVVESMPKQWVEYSVDLSERSIVDYNSGNVKIELLLSPDELKDNELVNAKMQEAVARLLSTKGKSSNYKSKYEEQIELSNTSVIGSQLDLTKFTLKDYYAEAFESSGRKAAIRPAAPPTPTLAGNTKIAARKVRIKKNNQASLANKKIAERNERERAEEAKRLEEEQIKAAREAKEREAKENKLIDIKEVEGKLIAKNSTEIAKTIVIESKIKREVRDNGKGAKVAVASLDLVLVKDHVAERAARFSGIIDTHSNTFGIYEPLIYAIMEQESNFNPVAKSWVPAYGLMQLVPTSGGRDAYNYVHKRDVIPSSSFLYDPNNNVELGTAYLKVLKQGSFRDIKDERCKLLCMIAAYNCGAGNVSRAINGTTAISRAIPIINTMSYDQLFSKFSRNLPSETQYYIRKVTRNLEKYSKK